MALWGALLMACGGGGDDQDPPAPDAAISDARAADSAIVVDAGVADATTSPDGGPPALVSPQLTAGFFHTCLLLPSGRVKCWGANFNGQLGLGDTNARGDSPGEMGDALPAIDLGTGRTAVAVAGGNDHTCAILDNGQVKCWGGNASGALGLGDTAPRGDGPGEMGDALPPVDLGTGRTALAIRAGVQFTCALLDDHTVKCWGANDVGQLGRGDTQNRGDEPGELGDALPAIDLGAGFAVQQLGAGQFYACAANATGTIKCWGDGNLGQFGGEVPRVVGDQANEMGDALVASDLGTDRTSTVLSVGKYHTCTIFADATFKCFGMNFSGQLGLGDTNGRGDNPGEMGDALPLVDVGTGRTVTAVAMSQNDTCALLDDGTVKCWGSNHRGTNGLGDTEPRGDGPGEMGDALAAVPLPAGRRIAQLIGGGEHVCVRFVDGGVRCWGLNNQGQLGQGSYDIIGDAPGEITALVDVSIGE